MKRKFCAGILIAIFLVSIWMLDRNCSVLIDSYDNAAVESVGMTDVMTGNVTDGDKPKIALTFDDGPHPCYTNQLLDGLKERGVCATFFVMGKNAEENPEVLKRVAREGHLIGNHSYSHAQLNHLSEEERCAELSKTYNLVYELTGQETQFVRPPFGEWNPSYNCNVDMIPVFWTIDTRDWTTEDVNLIVSRVVGNTKENDIILMHDYYESSIRAALIIVDRLQEQGYEFVTVNEVLMP